MATVDVSKLEVVHNPEENQFEIHLEGRMAVVEYQLAAGTMRFTHTYVPTAYESLGVGSKLARVSLDYALANSYKIQPACWFIAGYIERHPEYQSNL